MALGGTTVARTERARQMSAPDDLFDNYFQWFRVSIATTAEEIEEAHRIRYQVYCVETEFLKREDNPGGLEIDPFDAHSDQALLIHRPTDLTAGTVRLVRPSMSKDHGGLPARIASEALQNLRERLPLETTGEISRFAISKAFRQRQNDALFGALTEEQRAEAQAQIRRAIPHITLGLMQAIFVMSLRHNMTHLCAIIDPALLRLLSRLGLDFIAEGELVEFHGMRQPVWCEIESFLSGIYERRPDIWDIITDRGALSNFGTA